MDNYKLYSLSNSNHLYSCRFFWQRNIIFACMKIWETRTLLDNLETKFKMSSVSKADRKTALDVASWSFNIVTSVGIIMVNKALMATYGFSFGTFWMNISPANFDKLCLHYIFNRSINLFSLCFHMTCCSMGPTPYGQPKRKKQSPKSISSWSNINDLVFPIGLGCFCD